MKKLPTVSIIFPNFNGGKEPLDCLTSIQKLNYEKSKIETIVIDNNSQDGSDIKIKSEFPKVKLIKNSQNLGFAKAVNQGIKISKSNYVFVTNDDIVFEKNSLINLVNFAQQYSGASVIGGKIFYKYKPKKLASAGYKINIWTGAIKIAENPDLAKEPDWVQGCAILIPKLVFKKIGLFDTGFSHLFEDVDFCFRARRAGFKIIYFPNAKFWHGESLTADKNKSAKYLNWYKGKFRFIFKNLPIVNILSIVFIQTFLVIPYRAIVLKDGRLLPFIKGIIWNITNLSGTLKLRY